MSKSVHYRLPEQLLLDTQVYAKVNGVTITDVIIMGLQAVLQGSQSMAKSEIVVSGDTVYEPDPVKPVKQPKISVSKQAAPIVSAMLSGIRKQPTVQHHPQCKCTMCCPIT